MEKNNWKEASKSKLRFRTNKGMILPEDLFSLDLPDLDTLAIQANKEVKASQEESFIATRSTKNKTAELRLELLKEVITDKLDAKKKAEERAAKTAQLAFLQQVKEQKVKEDILGKTTEEIDAMIADLK